MADKPNYKVAVLQKGQNGEKSNHKNNNVGAGWKNADGTVSILLDPFIVIHGGKDILITLFPSEE